MLRSIRPVLLLGVLSTAACAAATGDRAGDDGAGQYETESVRCAGGATVEGIDISYYEGHVDFHAVKASGRGFVIARISDGGFHDPDFDGYWSGIKAAGLIRGAYQFIRFNQDPTVQADYVVSKVGMLGAGDLPVTADVEISNGVSGATIAAHLKTWAERVKAGTGKTPIIYTGKYFWRDSVGSNSFASDALWIAQYGPSCPDLPAPWTNWKFFQYSDKGSVPGVSGGVDVDKFNGTMADLIAFAGGDGGGGGVTPPPDPGGGSTPPPATGVCYSHTLGREVPLDTCVQSRADSKWYQCSGPNTWVDRWSDPAACSSVHPL